MKIIEALKQIKANNKKVADLIVKIRDNASHLTNQTSPYGEAARSVVTGWLDTVRQITRDNETLTNSIHRTNVVTLVPIDIGGGVVITKTIDEWLVRRKGGVDAQIASYAALTDRNLRETFVQQPDGTSVPVTIVRHFDALERDVKLASLHAEKSLIDSALEIINATTDLLE